MRQSEVFPYYRKCKEEMALAYEVVKDSFMDGYVDELCRLRGYFSDSHKALIKEMQIGCCSIDDVNMLDDFCKHDLGMVSAKGDIIINDRYIVPVQDVSGDVVSLIGYFPDRKKYITLPTPFFSKELMFFNFPQAYDLSWREYGGYVIVVEGIFDCLSLRSIGLPVMATMGSSVSELKGELLKLFSKVLGIPDDDKTGRRAFNRYDKNFWHLPFGSTMLKFHGGSLEIGGMKLHCKDMDNFVTWYEEDDVRETLLSYRDSKNDIEELTL